VGFLHKTIRPMQEPWIDRCLGGGCTCGVRVIARGHPRAPLAGGIEIAEKIIRATAPESVVHARGCDVERNVTECGQFIPVVSEKVGDGFQT
jgi:hypothetical protein